MDGLVWTAAGVMLILAGLSLVYLSWITREPVDIPVDAPDNPYKEYFRDIHPY